MGMRFVWGGSRQTFINRGPRDREWFKEVNGRFKAITGGNDHVCALSESGNAVCWGSYETYDYADIDAPGRRFGRDRCVAETTTCGLSTDGNVACWGSNQYGPIERSKRPFRGYQCRERSYVRVCDRTGMWRVGGSTTMARQKMCAVKVSSPSCAGDSHTCALRSDGSGACWGGGPTVFSAIRRPV